MGAELAALYARIRFFLCTARRWFYMAPVSLQIDSHRLDKMSFGVTLLNEDAEMGLAGSTNSYPLPDMVELKAMDAGSKNRQLVSPVRQALLEELSASLQNFEPIRELKKVAVAMLVLGRALKLVVGLVEESQQLVGSPRIHLLVYVHASSTSNFPRPKQSRFFEVV